VLSMRLNARVTTRHNRQAQAVLSTRALNLHNLYNLHADRNLLLSLMYKIITLCVVYHRRAREAAHRSRFVIHTGLRQAVLAAEARAITKGTKQQEELASSKKHSKVSEHEDIEPRSTAVRVF
jgi:hypothetical protein